ncbi:MAG: glycosyltransferase [Caldilineaceae bacterium]
MPTGRTHELRLGETVQRRSKPCVPVVSRAGFVSTRLAGTDGVSLETTKWAEVLARVGVESFFFAGECGWPAERAYIVPEAHFQHPDVLRLSEELFGGRVRQPETSQRVDSLKLHLKQHLRQFVMRFDLELLIVENAVAIPMNIPLGLAIAELVAETGMPVIAHNHDFAWERSRYATGAADDYLCAGFPPIHPSVTQVVINSMGQRQLALRTGANATIVPNVMDYDNPPPAPDGYVADLRAALDVAEDEYLLLQPTRIVPRKRIERAVELAARLDLPCTLVISHQSGDEGAEYATFLREYVALMGVKCVFAGELFAPERSSSANGRKIYSLADAYAVADIVTYPSDIEGFGNAFLEAVYYGKPLVMCAYDVYRLDIRPKGFRVVEFEDYMTEATVQCVREVLQDTALADEMAAHNYAVARQHYSFTVLERLLAGVLERALCA